MQRDKVVLYVHFISTTWDRLPMIAPEHEEALHSCMAAIATKHKCHVTAINGTPDHVHMLLALRSTVCVADLARQMKGGTSNFANSQLDLPLQFK